MILKMISHFQQLYYTENYLYLCIKYLISDDEKYDCAMCSYSLKSIRDTISEEEMAESLKKHIILEHFKANISPSVMEPPIEVPRQEPQLGLNDNDSTLVDSNGSLKCSICFTTFNQVYQRKIHERYFHSGKYDAKIFFLITKLN